MTGVFCLTPLNAAEYAIEKPSHKSHQSDAAKYQVIEGTISPNGRYGIALGLKGEGKVDWEQYKDSNLGGYFIEDEGEESIVVHYVVDIQEERILGKTHGHHFGTKEHYNHQGNKVIWSEDSLMFIQITDSKWFSKSCTAGQVSSQRSRLRLLDLAEELKQHAYTFLLHKKDPTYQKHLFNFAVSFQIESLTTDGEFEGKVIGEIPKSMEENSGFALKMRLKLFPWESRLASKKLSVDYDE